MSMTKLTGEEKQAVYDALLMFIKTENIAAQAGWITQQDFRKLCKSIEALCRIANISNVVAELRKQEVSALF